MAIANPVFPKRNAMQGSTPIYATLRNPHRQRTDQARTHEKSPDHGASGGFAWGAEGTNIPRVRTFASLKLKPFWVLGVVLATRLRTLVGLNLKWFWGLCVVFPYPIPFLMYSCVLFGVYSVLCVGVLVSRGILGCGVELCRGGNWVRGGVCEGF